MKKTITILLIILSMFVSKSQVSLVSASEKTCPGMDIEVKFKWNQSSGVTNFRIDYLSDNGILGAKIWEVENLTFYSLQKEIVSGDTVYIKNLNTQSWFPSGLINLSCGADPLTIELKCNDLTGINEYNLSNQKPVYYDLTGSIVEPKAGQILILKQGNNFKKVFIHE